MTLFPPIVILNGSKNSLWKRRETGWWHGVKNLLHWMASYRFSSPWWQILHVRLWWRLTFPSLWRAFPKSSFRTVVRMLCGKDGKRDGDTEWRIYYLGWHLTAFPTTVTDPSHSFRMTINVFSHYKPGCTVCLTSFWTGVRMLYEKAGKRQCSTEWRIYDSDDILPLSPPR